MHKNKSGSFVWLFLFPLDWSTGRHKKHCQIWPSEATGQHAMATLVCLPWKTACHAQPGLAWVDQSSRIKNAFIVFWHLLIKRHYLPNYPMNRCMHMLFWNYISIGMIEYSIHFAGNYCKSDENADWKEVIFFWGAHSTNPCGTNVGTSFSVEIDPSKSWMVFFNRLCSDSEQDWVSLAVFHLGTASFLRGL